MLEFDKNIFISKANFSDYIEEKVQADSDTTYFDEILKYSEEADLEFEDIIPMMSTVLLDKVKQSAIELGLYRNTSIELDKFTE